MHLTFNRWQTNPAAGHSSQIRCKCCCIDFLILLVHIRFLVSALYPFCLFKRSGPLRWHIFFFFTFAALNSEMKCFFSKAATPPGRQQRERTALGLEILWRLRVPRRLVLLRVPVGAVHTGTVSSASVREPEAPSGNDRWVISPVTSNKTAAVSSTVNKSNYSRCDGWRE